MAVAALMPYPRPAVGLALKVVDGKGVVESPTTEIV
jgi:hypothetical protein